MIKYFMKVCAVKLENEGCENCVSWKKLKNTNRKYCCHDDAFNIKTSAVTGKYQELKNNDMHKKWNRKLDCKRFEQGIEDES